METFENLKRVAINELKKLDTKYAGKEEFAEGDLKTYDCAAHALKCHLTALAMLEAEEMGGMSETGSYGRNSQNGQYTSNQRSYAAGYSEGYAEGRSEAMNQVSGHWPQQMRYPGNRVY